MTKLIWGSLLLGLGSAAFAITQSTPTDATSGQAAIVWTGMQQPVPEPAQDTSAKEIPPAQQSAEQNTERSPERQEQPGAQKPEQGAQPVNPATGAEPEGVRALTGTVVKENNGYFLHMNDNSEFQVDDAAKVRDFENRAVRVTGTVDSSTRTIHVRTVQPST